MSCHLRGSQRHDERVVTNGRSSSTRAQSRSAEFPVWETVTAHRRRWSMSSCILAAGRRNCSRLWPASCRASRRRPTRTRNSFRGRSDQWQMDVYDGEPRYEAVRDYVSDPDPERVLAALGACRTVGHGRRGRSSLSEVGRCACGPPAVTSSSCAMPTNPSRAPSRIAISCCWLPTSRWKG